jgi:hypothetical protein
MRTYMGGKKARQHSDVSAARLPVSTRTLRVVACLIGEVQLRRQELTPPGRAPYRRPRKDATANWIPNDAARTRPPDPGRRAGTGGRTRGQDPGAHKKNVLVLGRPVWCWK